MSTRKGHGRHQDKEAQGLSSVLYTNMYRVNFLPSSLLTRTLYLTNSDIFYSEKNIYANCIISSITVQSSEKPFKSFTN